MFKNKNGCFSFFVIYYFQGWYAICSWSAHNNMILRYTSVSQLLRFIIAHFFKPGIPQYLFPLSSLCYYINCHYINMCYCTNHKGLWMHLLRSPYMLQSTPGLFRVKQFKHYPLLKAIFKTTVKASSAETFCFHCTYWLFHLCIKNSKKIERHNGFCNLIENAYRRST